MCKVSVIVPVYNVEKYLRTCMESLVTQTLEDIEIIVVNDGSSDNSQAILEEYEQRYPQKIMVYKIENHGVSYARNYGARYAEGEYLLFVDSDDYIEPTMCQKLYEKAIRDGNDLVICGYNNVYEMEPGDKKRKFDVYTPVNQNFSLEECPYEMLNISPFPWDKLIKRELFLQLFFPEGLRFEDLEFVLKVLCLAGNIGIVKEALYNYRRDVAGFLNTFTKSTLDITKALGSVVNFYRENGFFEKYKEELEYKCAFHIFTRYTAMLDKIKGENWEMKMQLLKETYAFMNEQFPGWENNRYLKYSSPPRINNRMSLYKNENAMKYLLLMEKLIPEKIWMFGTHAVGNIFKKTVSFLKSPSKIKKTIIEIEILRIFKMPGNYGYTKAYLNNEVDRSIVLFESKHGEDIAGNIFNMLRIFQMEEYREFEVHLVLTDKTKQKWEKMVEIYHLERVHTVKRNSKDYHRLLSCAGYLVTDTSFPTYYIKKPEQIYLNTWHGTPLKGMGRRVPEREYGLGNVQRNFLIADWLLYQNAFSRDVFVDDYMIRDIYPGRIMLSGYPRNSALLQPELEAKIREENHLEGKQLIAYMPTWRGLLHKKDFGRQVTEIYLYLAKIDELLEDDQILFVKLHPYVGDVIEYDCFKHIRPFITKYDTYDFLNATDILVTDYSSIMFDYAVSGKKIVLFTYDREKYLKERGMYIDLNKIEFPIADTVEELISELRRPNAGYPQFKKEYCRYDSEMTALEVCRAWVFGCEHMKCEKTLDTSLPSVLLYAEEIADREKFIQIVQMVNRLPLDKFHFYLAFRAADAQENTDVLSQLDYRAGYFPLQDGNNALRSELAAKWFYDKLHLEFGFIEKRVFELCVREAKKHFGEVKFAYVVHLGGQGRFNRKMLRCVSGDVYLEKEEFIKTELYSNMKEKNCCFVVHPEIDIRNSTEELQ